MYVYENKRHIFSLLIGYDSLYYKSGTSGFVDLLYDDSLQLC